MKEFNGVLGFTYLYVFLEETLSCSHKQHTAEVSTVILSMSLNYTVVAISKADFSPPPPHSIFILNF